MARIHFTSNLQRHVACAESTAPGCTVREVLDAVFAANPGARGYVLDDQGALRRHMNLYIDGARIRDRIQLSDPVAETSSIHVLQALSGG